VARKVAHHLAAAGGVADVDRALQVEMRDQRGEVVGVMIHVVAACHLARAAVPAAVVGDDAVAPVQEIHHLDIPVVGAERPAVGEHDRRAAAPVLVEDLDAILRCHTIRSHLRFPFR